MDLGAYAWPSTLVNNACCRYRSAYAMSSPLLGLVCSPLAICDGAASPHGDTLSNDSDCPSSEWERWPVMWAADGRSIKQPTIDR